MKKLLITGCPRSGTGYMAESLTRGGVPCGHERVFNLSTAPGKLPSWPNDCPAVESSWLAVPALFKLWPDVGVLHLVRNPLYVIRSLLRIGFWTRAESTAYCWNALEFLGWTGEPLDSPIVESMRLWLAWNEAVEPYADERVKVEQAYEVFPPSRWCHLLPEGSSPDWLEAIGTPANWNTADRGEFTGELLVDDLRTADGRLFKRLKDKAHEYGYEL